MALDGLPHRRFGFVYPVAGRMGRVFLEPGRRQAFESRVQRGLELRAGGKRPIPRRDQIGVPDRHFVRNAMRLTNSLIARTQNRMTAPVARHIATSARPRPICDASASTDPTISVTISPKPRTRATTPKTAIQVSAEPR